MRFVVVVAGGLLLRASAAVCGPAPGDSRPGVESALSPGAPAEFELEIGGGRRHALTLEAGAFVSVELREKGPRVVLSLLDPAGSVVARREVPADIITSYRLLAIAPIGGEYILEARAFGQDGPGRYEIRLEEPRPATERDRGPAGADAALAEAGRLAAAGTTQSRQQALARLQAAEGGFRQAGDGRGEAWAVRDRGLVQYSLGDGDAAASFDLALGLFRGLGDQPGQAVALNGLGQTRNRAGDREGALALTRQAAGLAERAADRRALANYLINAGVLLDHSGWSESAIDNCTRGLALGTEAGSRRAEARALNNMGVAYQNLGEQRQALGCYQRALPLYRAASSRLGEVIALGNISNLHFALDDYEQALAFFEQALPLAQAAGLGDEEAQLLKNVSKVYRALGDHTRAIEVARRSVELWRQSGDRQGEGEALKALGSALHAAGDNEAARESLRQALAIDASIHERFGEAETLYALAQVERDRGDLREALAHAEACITLTEELRGAMTNPELRGSFQAAEQDKYGLLIGLLMIMHEHDPTAGHDAAALQVSERARGRLLLEALIEARADIRQGVDARLLDQERTLQKRLREASARLETVPTGQDAVRAREEAEALTQEYGRVQSRIRQQSPRYAALTQPVPATLEQVRRDVLDGDTVLLEFYLGEERSFLWAVTPSSLASQALPGQKQIDGAAREVHQLLTGRQRARAPDAVRRADGQLDDEAMALSRLLLGGVASSLSTEWKGKRLLIVASGALAYLPFGALPSPAEGVARPLLLDHEVVFAPSASVLVALRNEPTAAAGTPTTVAVLADPVFDAADPRVRAHKASRRAAPEVEAGLAGPAPSATGLTRAMEGRGGRRLTRLPFSRAEANALAALVPARSLLKATDFAAARPLVTEGALSDRRILHFATHGLLNTEHPDLSGLVLSLVDEKGAPRDGFLRMQEIYNLRLSADLVVLSACQTALGREMHGEGLVGLTRGFMYAGAHRVVASLWQVDDESTAELMKRFYRAMLRDGKRPAAALRAAQLEMSRTKRWSAPFYWAGFVLQGEWR